VRKVGWTPRKAGDLTGSYRSFLPGVEDDPFAFGVASCELRDAARRLWPSTSRASSLRCGIAPDPREFVGQWMHPHACGIFHFALQGPDTAFLF
jgi:hypothetical protein